MNVTDFVEVCCYTLNCILMLFSKPCLFPKKVDEARVKHIFVLKHWHKNFHLGIRWNIWHSLFMCRYWMIVTMLHLLIKELIKRHPSDAAELIKGFTFIAHGLADVWLKCCPTPTMSYSNPTTELGTCLSFRLMYPVDTGFKWCPISALSLLFMCKTHRNLSLLFMCKTSCYFLCAVKMQE